MCPLPGETYPNLDGYRVLVTEQQREMADNFIHDFILDKQKANENDIQVNISQKRLNSNETNIEESWLVISASVSYRI